MPGFTPAPSGGGGVAVLVASDTLRAESTGEVSAESQSYVKIKAIKAPMAMQTSGIRTTFTLKEGGTGWVKGRIYVNDVAVGVEHENDTDVYETYTDDFEGINPEDEIQLYVEAGTQYQSATTDSLCVKGDTDHYEDPLWKVTM